MNGLAADVRDSWRRWRSAPVVNAVAVLSLALGMGVALAVFALVHAFYLRSLPVEHAERLARIVAGHGDYVFQPAVWEVFHRDQRIFDGVAAVAPSVLQLEERGESRHVDGLYVSGDFFNVLGVPMILGRGLTRDDDRPQAVAVAVISQPLWQQMYGRSTALQGQTITIAGRSLAVVGVSAASFYGVEIGRRIEVIVPLAVEPWLATSESRLKSAAVPWLYVFGRLRPNQGHEQAGATLRAWQPALRAATLPVVSAMARLHLSEPLDVVSGRTYIAPIQLDFGRQVLFLLAAVAPVLVIGCANVAALLLARFTDRHEELGIRVALGASSWRLVRGMVTEGLLLSGAGAVGGVTLSVWLVQLVAPLLLSPLQPTVPDFAVRLNLSVVLAALAAAILTGIAAGLIPALRLMFFAPLRAADWSRATPRPAPVLKMLVAAQMVLAMILTSCAALLIHSFAQLIGQPTGVDGDRVLLASLQGPFAHAEPDVTLTRIDALRRALESIPGVEAASASTLTPLSGRIMLFRLEVDGFGITDQRDLNVAVNRITPHFLKVFGSPLRDGRDFNDGDRAGFRRVAIVNSSFVDHYLGGALAVGRTIRLNGQEVEIVGVVASGKYMNLREPARHFVYVPLAQWLGAQPVLRFAVRGPDPGSLRPPFVQTVRKFNPALTVEFRTLRDEIWMGANPERLLAFVGAVFALLALLMSALGIFAVLGYLVMRRRREIGIRMALGAQPRAILAMVLLDGARIITIGCLLGTAGTFAAGGVIRGFLYGIEPNDPLALAMAAVVLVGVAGLASYLPARAAAMVTPMTSLRGF